MRLEPKKTDAETKVQCTVWEGGTATIKAASSPTEPIGEEKGEPCFPASSENRYLPCQRDQSVQSGPKNSQSIGSNAIRSNFEPGLEIPITQPSTPLRDRVPKPIFFARELRWSA